MLDLELRVLLRQLAAVEPVDDRALHLAETARSPRWPARAPESPESARSSWTDGTASRAAARMKARLKRGWAINSWAQTNRVPSCTPAAPISRYDSIASPRPMPPATKTGTSVRCGSISCASTAVETGPIWPPASLPSMTIASAPDAHQLAGDRQGRREADDAGAAVAQTLDRRRCSAMPPASTTWPTRRRDADLDQLAQAAGAS